MRQAQEQAGAGTASSWQSWGIRGWQDRLFHEFPVRRAPRAGSTGKQPASYSQATPYLPVIDLLKAYFQLEDRDDARRMREKLTGRLLTLDPALGPTLPAFLALLEVPVEDPAGRPSIRTTPPAHPGRPQTPVAAGEPGAAPPPDL